MKKLRKAMFITGIVITMAVASSVDAGSITAANTLIGCALAVALIIGGVQGIKENGRRG